MMRTSLVALAVLLMASGTGLAASEYEKQLTERFAKVDKNRDGALRGAELPEKWVDRFDRNGDEKITKREFMVVMTRPEGLRRLFVLRDTRARARNSLNFDQDKNGVVSEEEYPGDRNVFRKADRDRDGSLEWKELLRLADSELDDIRKRMKNPTRYEMMNLFDLNYDRKVTSNEYDGPTKAFKKYDTNNDGTVGYYEVYPDRMEREMPKPKPEDLNVLKAMDQNDDGRVSRKEWKGTASAWRRLDRNDDGWITLADAR